MPLAEPNGNGGFLYQSWNSWVIVNFVDLLSIFGGTVGESKITDSLNIVLMYDGIFVLWQTSIYFKFSWVAKFDLENGSMWCVLHQYIEMWHDGVGSFRVFI